MCGLFGFSSYGNQGIKDLSALTNSLARHASVRGTDATGISYVRSGYIHISKDAKEASKIKFKHPDDIKALIGPLKNDNIDIVANVISSKGIPMFVMTSSEDLVRRYSSGTAGVLVKEPFMWSLSETDIVQAQIILAKAGAIVPFTEDIYGKNMDKNPDSLVWNVFAGADGEFELYEDDNVSQKYMEDICVKTKAEFVWDDKVQSFTIHKAVGELSLIPEKRTHTVKIWGVEKSTELDVPFTYDYEKKCLSIELKDVSVTEEIIISFKEKLVLAQNRVKEHLFNLLNKAEIPFEYKNKAYYTIVESDNVFAAMNALRAHHLPEEIEGAVMEILLAY